MNVVTIGGATGHSRILEGLRLVSGVRTTAVITPADDGGSSGWVARIYPEVMGSVGDITKCAAALSAKKDLVEGLAHRFDKRLHENSAKNLMFLGLIKELGAEAALEALWEIYGLGHHRVLPVSLHRTQLRASVIDSTGKLREVRGESRVGNLAKRKFYNEKPGRIRRLYLVPEVDAYPVVLNAIREADLIIPAPGDLYTSILPPLLVRGMKEEIQRSRARIVLFLNLMTRKGETDGFSAEKFMEQIKEAIGGREFYRIIHDNAHLSRRVLSCYGEEQKVHIREFPLDPFARDEHLICAPLAKAKLEGGKWHLLHNPLVVAKVMREIIRKIEMETEIKALVSA